MTFGGGTCEHCGVFSRRPCESKKTAASCGNNDDPGSCLEFQARDVAAWIRYNSDNPELLEAANLIEQEL